MPRRRPSPIPRVIVPLLAALLVVAAGGPPQRAQSRLRELFPEATSFSEKEGNPPHFKAFAAGADGTARLLGFAFYTTDLEPLERGYDGPIRVLVGMDLTGTITRIVVVDHTEPYGYFSVDLPEYAAQFTGKRIRDRFRVGADIDAISTATLSVTSATRAIRNGARRLARQFLDPEDVR